MNILDGILLLLIAGGVIRGYRKGLILQAFSLVGAIFALLAAYRFSGDFSRVLMERFPLSEEVGGGLIGLLPIEGILYRVVAFILLFVGVKILISIIARLLTGLFDVPVLSQINRLGGVLLNLIQVFLIIFSVFICELPSWETDVKRLNPSSPSVLEATPDLTERISGG